ncbi:NFATC2-interacting protein-like isoform X2 [Centruroides vittatus]|uniref:NFATC2-interacting protein-like isoform X2 n=1 Tax=Centruroides vittatus TaxID=120091 RepID=UPI00351047A9
MENVDSPDVICLSDSEDVIVCPEKVSSKLQEVLITLESDDSSDEENVNFLRKRVTRRGLKLDDFDSSNAELEEELETSNIYTSRVYSFRKERNHFYENLPAFLSSIPLDNDVEVLDKKSEEQENVSNACKRLCVHNVNNSPPSVVESPSPPPQITTVPINFSKRNRRTTNKILSEMENSKRIYNASRKNYDFEKSQMLDPDLLDINYQRTLMVKFRWQDTILRIPMQMKQKFATVLPELAEKCKADISDIFLAIKEESIKAEDSPDSHGLTSADIIECYIIKSSNLENDENKLNLKIQASDSKKKITISINKLSPMSCLMEEYAKQRDISLEKLKFMFDGELLKSTDTAFDLEMENDSCIDVVVSQ